MKRLEICLMAVILSLVFGLSAPRKAEARLQYFKAFEKAYGSKIEAAAEAKCGICHGGENGKNKKKLSKYAEELKSALGEKNVKDEEKIEGALKEVEKKEYDSGKTYGDLLNSGKLPPAAEE